MLSKEEYRQVARIHEDGISKGFLSSLGLDFLSLLYESIDNSQSSNLIVVRTNGVIVGFVAGTLNIRDVYRVMIRSSGRLLVSLLPVFFSPRRIFRIVETLLFSSKFSSGESYFPSAELLSISVSPECRGKGYAEDLFMGLVSKFKSNNVTQFKIIVGVDLHPAHRFYRRMGALPVANVVVHSGCGSVVYVYAIE